MPKSHVVSLTIRNNTALPLSYVADWFDSGRLADGASWPSSIAPGDHVDNIQCYEKDWATAGCSGLVEYSLGDLGTITIAFSNPSAGKNKLGVGTATALDSSNTVWADMSDHNYQPFADSVLLGNQAFSALCSCTGGPVNTCVVTFS